MPIKIALPKGRLLGETAARLQQAGWGLRGYHQGSRHYRLKSDCFPNLSAKVFHEKDVPIQVAIGNYDLGVCGLDWLQELLAKYPSSALVKVKDLGYGGGMLYMMGSQPGVSSLEEVRAKPEVLRIASEYPNLAESFALDLRLKQFSVFPLWGGADVYPPDSADLALISCRRGRFFSYNLVPIKGLLAYDACLIANRDSWQTKDMKGLLASLKGAVSLNQEVAPSAEVAVSQYPSALASGDVVRLALPDGHQQQPTLRLLTKAGIGIDDYPSPTGNRRPTISLSGVMVKVIRPQDMPLQVANGNFDLAITGKDWVREHRYQFPSIPIAELADLRFGEVKIVAVVANALPISDIGGLRQMAMESPAPLRVASEYINIADKYARDNHLGMYRVVPTWGASEAFLPEDADLLVENTQTGRTLAENNLKIIDTLFESSACLIGNTTGEFSPIKGQRVDAIVKALRMAAEVS
ncbi:MAG: ATP phosphoribosyltransferase [Dehalococcoidales bacterium]|nr:ATP phosphoribosyltransferase [Dehalococcoidales bacterium]